MRGIYCSKAWIKLIEHLDIQKKLTPLSMTIKKIEAGFMKVKLASKFVYLKACLVKTEIRLNSQRAELYQNMLM